MKRVSLIISGKPISSEELIEQVELARRTSKKYTLQEARKILRL
jgi:hypothetical protein